MEVEIMMKETGKNIENKAAGTINFELCSSHYYLPQSKWFDEFGIKEFATAKVRQQIRFIRSHLKMIWNVPPSLRAAVARCVPPSPVGKMPTEQPAGCQRYIFPDGF
jgi:hypothetical protein